MKILFVGPLSGRSLYQYLSLKKLYHNVDTIDLLEIFFWKKISLYIFWNVSPKLFETLINKYFISKIKKKSYDLVYVREGEYIGLKLILLIKNYTKKIIFYCADNPFVNRDNRKWDLMLPAIKHYDLIVFQQFSRRIQAKKYNLKNILTVYPSYTKKFHCPQKIRLKEKKKLQNDIIFIGTWFPERGIFFRKLYAKGLKFKIYGTRWNKDKLYSSLKSRIVLGHVDHPLYSKLVYCSKIVIGLVSKGNKDDITDRTIEVPAIGSLLCAIGTKTHKKLFIENKEAIFFKNADECFQKCKKLLRNEKLIKKISLNGYLKVTKKLKLSTDEIIKKIVSFSMR